MSYTFQPPPLLQPTMSFILKTFTEHDAPTNSFSLRSLLRAFASTSSPLPLHRLRANTLRRLYIPSLLRVDAYLLPSSVYKAGLVSRFSGPFFFSCLRYLAKVLKFSKILITSMQLREVANRCFSTHVTAMKKTHELANKIQHLGIELGKVVICGTVEERRRGKYGKFKINYDHCESFPIKKSISVYTLQQVFKYI